MWINNEQVDFGWFRSQNGGSTSNGVSWQVVVTGLGQLGFTSKYNDRIIRIDLQVPRSSGLYSNGKLTLKFFCDLDQSTSDESCGIDNIRIAADKACSEDGLEYQYVGYLHTQNYAWHENNAHALGCTMASITNDAEHKAVFEACEEIGASNCLIGLRHRIKFNENDVNDPVKWAQMKDPTATLWKWSDNRPFTYSKWNTGEPNAFYGSGNRKQVEASATMSYGEWSDKWEESKWPAVYRCPV